MRRTYYSLSKSGGGSFLPPPPPPPNSWNNADGWYDDDDNSDNNNNGGDNTGIFIAFAIFCVAIVIISELYTIELNNQIINQKRSYNLPSQ